jgi:AGCS family alanine or glycine:cation symporter
LTILCSGVIIDYGNAAALPVMDAFSVVYGDFSHKLLALMLCLFGISSIIGWAVYGINCSHYLFGNTGKKIFVYIYPFFCVIGAVLKVNTVWRIAEFFNGIMIVINLFSIFSLSDKITPVLKGNKNDKRKN